MCCLGRLSLASLQCRFPGPVPLISLLVGSFLTAHVVLAREQVVARGTFSRVCEVLSRSAGGGVLATMYLYKYERSPGIRTLQVVVQARPRICDVRTQMT
jgi:hypothetical protein